MYAARVKKKAAGCLIIGLLGIIGINKKRNQIQLISLFHGREAEMYIV